MVPSRHLTRIDFSVRNSVAVSYGGSMNIAKLQCYSFSEQDIDVALTNYVGPDVLL